MRNLFCSKLTVLGIAGAIACSLLILPADARRAYDSSGSGSQSSSSTQNPYAINQYSPPTTTTSTSTTTSTNTSSTSQSAAPTANQYMSPQKPYSPPSAQQYTPLQNQYTPPRNQYTSPRNQFTPPQNQYAPPQNQYTQQQGTNLYPGTTKNNGTNFYGISPEQISGGAAVHENIYPANGGGGRGGYDPRWNPNFGTGAGAQVMARESGGLAQSLRDNFPLPMSGDEAQMFQINDFAARSNGGMQSRRP
jgi:hypothetical protein